MRLGGSSRHTCRCKRNSDRLSVDRYRRRQLPHSTALRKLSTLALNAKGSSRLIAWPVLGQIQSPALVSADFSNRLVSRQRTSSSPTASHTGTVILESWSRRSCIDGRKA